VERVRLALLALLARRVQRVQWVRLERLGQPEGQGRQEHKGHPD
jgi:hypothetical protein